MSEVKKLQRYQNPELFERLAMEYAIGLLHGWARKRFESLMEKHLYLRATTEVYEHQFAKLAELLPEQKPNPRVWRNVQKKVKGQKAPVATQASDKASLPWWKSLKLKMAGFVTALVIAVGATLSLFPLVSVQADGYIALLESDAHKTMAMATVNKGGPIKVQLMEKFSVPEGKELALWCYPKDKNGKKMMMGTISGSGQSSIEIDEKMWHGLADVSRLVITVEPAGAKDLEAPEGELLYKGDLKIMSKNG